MFKFIISIFLVFFCISIVEAEHAPPDTPFYDEVTKVTNFINVHFFPEEDMDIAVNSLDSCERAILLKQTKRVEDLYVRICYDTSLTAVEATSLYSEIDNTFASNNIVYHNYNLKLLASRYLILCRYNLSDAEKAYQCLVSYTNVTDNYRNKEKQRD